MGVPSAPERHRAVTLAQSGRKHPHSKQRKLRSGLGLGFLLPFFFFYSA